MRVCVCVYVQSAHQLLMITGDAPLTACYAAARVHIVTRPVLVLGHVEEDRGHAGGSAGAREVRSGRGRGQGEGGGACTCQVSVSTREGGNACRAATAMTALECLNSSYLFSEPPQGLC